MPAFTVLESDGTPASNLQVIVSCPGEKGYGITNRQGFVTVPMLQEFGKIIINGRTVYYGSLEVDALRI
ncbi:hypothetical protein [Pontibacter sp. G13]|uniref:hypothetical protein n=1 Tax=Pontibacter sp. G13 TaxID=3074898 RepID=UPI00288BDCF8|nr:hypothetical protein [Pontibacter sp. G13]WNJ20662.1 hypothetical protein RJD25_09280 [Pontibacter sp. G13]